MQSFSVHRHLIGMLFQRGLRWRLVVAVFGSFGLALLDAVSVVAVAPMMTAMTDSWRAGISGEIASRLGIDDQNQLLYVLLAFVVVSFIIKDILTIVYTWWTATFSARARSAAQVRMTNHLLHRPYEEQANLGLAGIMRVASTAATQAYYGYIGSVLGILTQVMSVATLVVAMLLVSPIIVGVLLLLMGLFAWLYVRTTRSVSERIGRRSLETGEEIYNGYFNAFGAAKDVKIRNAYAFFLKQISVPVEENALLGRTTSVLATLPKNLMEILFMVGLALTFGLAILLGFVGNILATLAVIIAGAFRMLPTLAALVGTMNNIRQNLPGAIEFVDEMKNWDALADDIDLDQEISGNAAVVPLPFEDEIRIDDVRFTYKSTGAEVLKGVDFVIKPGTKVAFVGSSGAGKSTLLDLVMGLLEPTSGAIYVDGASLADNAPRWRAHIGLVPQEVFITDRSIAENVAFDVAADEIDESLVWECLEAAEMADFVRNHPGGLWAGFGERGAKLSGGQRQRIGIARALYRRPAVLVLDEATSALDNETEAKITDTISSLRGELTVIVVAHRLSTVQDADDIAYLEGGRLLAHGSFLELQDRSEGFRRLVALGHLETVPEIES